MIIRNNDLPREDIEGYAGGQGVLEFTTLVPSYLHKDDAIPFYPIGFEPGACIGEHSHEDNIELYFFLGGHGIAVDDGKEVAVTTGDVVYTADGASHSIRDAGDGDLVMLACVIYENKAE